MEEWIEKIRRMYTMAYYSALEKTEISPFVTTWMDLESMMLSEINQTGKGVYQIISLRYGI